MNKYRFSLIFVILFSFSLCGFSQQIIDLKLNEILIKNDSNFVDEYGRHVPWIEIFNSAYNSVNISECYLTDDTTGLADGTGIQNWYRVPKGDPHTLILQRSFLVFFLDNSPLYGTFHTNFDPATSKTDYVALISSNGRKLIDIIKYPASLRNVPHSFGFKNDGIGEKDYLEYFTPGSCNKVMTDLTKSERMAKEDPSGLGLALIAMSVVFIALILIFLMLKLFGKLSSRQIPKKSAKTKTPVVAAVEKINEEDGEINAEEIAAITMALSLHLGTHHDKESEIITIESPSAHYSPWAQKQLTFKRVSRKF